MNPVIQVKKLFFDSATVINAMAAKDRKALSRIGAFVRQRARTSMRRRKAISLPGQPPSAHEGSLRDKLYFSYDPSTRSLVVGPAKYKKGIAGILEKGGESEIVRKGTTKTVTIAARPFMGPALAAEAPKMPSQWEGSLSVSNG